ncbi:NBS-containing resistance-like protein [Trifolium pratense]|uniref:NBS-containing resistance-like protein n=3 Tax=Trifolium pratense TaxID=57577 RepID=A0A2K3JR67_TRIPR|nr:NBS-containing resistance-like protein [Trifolium pratense]
MAHLPKLKEIPPDIHLLKNLETLRLIDTPHEFHQSIDPNGGSKNWVIEHVQMVTIVERVGPNPNSFDFSYRTFRHPKVT